MIRPDRRCTIKNGDFSDCTGGSSVLILCMGLPATLKRRKNPLLHSRVSGFRPSANQSTSKKIVGRI
ncbi:MAG: hypothetical protein JWO30_4903 [Fibrobacteres bacterium]|nr:hypothetical protein [Fibrobacterota bacterium]